MPACAPGRSQAASQLVSHSVSASTCYVTQTHILTHTHRHTGTCMKHVISYTVNGWNEKNWRVWIWNANMFVRRLRVAIHIASMHGRHPRAEAQARARVPSWVAPTPWLFARLPIFLDCVKDAAGAALSSDLCIPQIHWIADKKRPKTDENSKRCTQRMNEKPSRWIANVRAACYAARHATRRTAHSLRQGPNVRYSNPINMKKNRWCAEECPKSKQNGRGLAPLGCSSMMCRGRPHIALLSVQFNTRLAFFTSFEFEIRNPIAS